MLQCGDPTGTGAGSIGFTIKEENLTGATYPARHARHGQDLVKRTRPAASSSWSTRTAQLPPDYTVAGHITSGLDVLDKLQAVGDDGSNGTGDGAPKEAIFLENVTVTKS